MFTHLHFTLLALWVYVPCICNFFWTTLRASGNLSPFPFTKCIFPQNKCLLLDSYIKIRKLTIDRILLPNSQIIQISSVIAIIPFIAPSPNPMWAWTRHVFLILLKNSSWGLLAFFYFLFTLSVLLPPLYLFSFFLARSVVVFLMLHLGKLCQFVSILVIGDV